MELFRGVVIDASTGSRAVSIMHSEVSAVEVF